jgi:class 3 adenylate cyclase
MPSLSFEELANQAEVSPDFVERLVDLGAVEPKDGDASYDPADAGRVRLLHAWEEAGLAPEDIMSLVEAGELSISWLDAPVIARAMRIEVTFEQLCSEEEVRFRTVQALYESIGFAPPEATDRVRAGDRELVDLLREFMGAGAGEGPTLRLLRVYADSVRRMAKAEAELYESAIEEPLRRSGRSEGELIDFGARFGGLVNAQLEHAFVDIYRRHREHIWIEHSIEHAEMALERAGLFEKVPKPPAICFVDLTGYTRLTEERGDEFAAELASNLASLVEDISRRRGGRPIRWLGDGGMFHFKEPQAAVLAGLDMVESAPRAELPPMHIGVHTGPVVFQDGDVYGRTVNLASRIASHATAGQVLASQETAGRASGAGVRFEPVGPVDLKGVAEPVDLFQAFRAG